MKLTIDTDEKKIFIHKECNVLELINTLHKLMGDKIQDFTLEVLKEEYYSIQINPLSQGSIIPEQGFNQQGLLQPNTIYYNTTTVSSSGTYTMAGQPVISCDLTNPLTFGSLTTGNTAIVNLEQ